MRVLLIDAYGYGLDMALDFKAWGHEVRWFIPPLGDGRKNTTGDGYFKKIYEWEPSMEWADLVVLTSNRKYLRQIDRYRKDGYPVFGPCAEVTGWEFDRMLGQEVLKRSGIHTLDMTEFNTFNEGIDYIRANPGRYACKPSADMEDKALAHVGKCDTGKDLIFMLEHWRDSGAKKYKYVLQPFSKGIEMAVGGHFGLNGWVGPWVHNFEFKKLMNAEIGPNTGEMGTVVYYAEESKLADTLLTPLTAELIRIGYTGYIDVSAIITPKGVVNPLEFTSRSGWPLEWILTSLNRGDPAKWRLDAVNGVDSLATRSNIAIGVYVTQPPFPYQSAANQDDLSGYPLWGSDTLGRDCHLVEMKLGEGVDDALKRVPMPVSAGFELALVTGLSDTVSGAMKKVYTNVDKLQFPNCTMYRTDIGGRLEKQLDDLHDLGFVDKRIKF
jgi:phosphoribosylamine---glycine ligase